MNVSILQGQDQAALQKYVDGKFTSWRNNPFYPRSFRDDKCIEYYNAASTVVNQGCRFANYEIVASRYNSIFQVTFPYQKAKEVAAKKSKSPTKVEWSEGLKRKEKELKKYRELLALLKKWKEDKEYQTGEEFYEKLRTQVDFVQKGLCDPTRFIVEHDAVLAHEATATHEVSGQGASASFDAMIGVKQHIDAEFTYFNPRIGEVSAKLNEAFKAGAWASGEAKAKLNKLGFDLDVQAAIAFGAELDVNGECSWKRGDLGLQLAGNCTLFAGAQGNFAASLSANALKGINAAISAGAFAGVSANVGGTFTFTYGDEELVSTNATAGVSYGVGGQFSANLSIPIFGPTSFGFSASAAVGLGVQTSVNTSVNFSEVALATSAEARKLLYIPTLMRG